VILSDKSIREAIESGRLGIDPFDPKLVQPSSIDVRLDNKFLVFRNTKRAYIDVKQPADDLMEMIEVGVDDPMFLHPHEFVLASTIERVRMPDDLVARLEGRSSLGRLGVVIHSSLPYDEPVFFVDEAGVLEARPIGEIVENRLRGQVIGFDQDTFEVAFHQVTNWFRELPDKIYEVRFASGRKVHVTAGHNLFTLSASGDLVKTPTRALEPGTRVAIPKWIPDRVTDASEYRLVDLLAAETLDSIVCQGPTVEFALTWFGDEVRNLLRDAHLSLSYYVRHRVLPLIILKRLHGGVPKFGALDWLRYRGSGSWLPAVLRVDRELAWLLGLYVAEGYLRDKQVIIANTDQRILDRAEAAFGALGQTVYRSRGAITCCSRLVSALFKGFSMGTGASSKRLPKGALGWSWRLLDSLLEGMIDGDGSIRPERECLWTTSDQLVSDVLVLCARLGKRAVTQVRVPRPGWQPLHVVSIATNRHKVLSPVPNPSRLLVDIRAELGLTQLQASRMCGYAYPTSLNNVERDRNGGTVHVATLERIHDSYSRIVPSVFNPIGKLTRLVNSDIQWDEVAEVVDTGRFEVVYDLEVRSPTAHVENFLAGRGGVFTSNTAGFIDPSFEGHVTLEISNLANLPIALYPRMRIGQLSFSLMTTPAERPYGPGRGSKYSGQDVPTASRLYLDFQQP
jgi:deoxycytidine triphosphate deaminase/intein/homing endonuclease